MVLILLLILAPQRETFYELYESGIEKLKQHKEAEAIGELEKAIALRPDSKAQARTYSMFTIVYTPYYYLTKAYLAEKRYRDAADSLSRAFEQGEDTFEGGRLVVELEIINQLMPDLLEKEERIRTLENAKSVERPDFLPSLEKLFLQDFDAAVKEVKALRAAYINQREVRAQCDSLLEFIQQERKRIGKEEDLKKRIGVLTADARDKELGELFPAALQAYQHVLSIDPNNEESEAGVARVRKRLEDEGKTEQEILELQKSNEERTDMMKQLSRDFLKMKADKEASEKERISMRERLLKLPPPQLKEEVRVDWTVKPGRTLVANIQAKVESTIPLRKVVIFMEGEEIKSWTLSTSRKLYTTPFLANYPVGKPDTVFELKAWGIDGNVYSDTYPFSFAPPINLFSKKIRYSLTIFLTGVITLFFFLIQYRRRKLFRQRFNPYIAGAPILNQKMFYGREATLKQILNTLHNNSLMIFGERRIGKTSFLHRLNEDLPGIQDPQYEFIPIFVDLQGVKEEDFFQTLDQEIAQVLATREIYLEAPVEPFNARQFIARLRRFINALKESCQKKPKLVLLLDEVDVMNGFTEQTNQQLRSVFMKGFAEHIVAVMAGININKNWKSEGSPWYNFFEQIELKPFQKNLADDLITRPVQGVYNYTNAAIQRIIEITDGKPYLIQKMCLNLVSHILVENRRQITVEDVEYVFKGIEKEFYGA